MFFPRVFFFAVFLSYCPIFFHSGTEDVGHGVNSYKKIPVKGGTKQCEYYLISWGRGEIHGDYFITDDIPIPIIEGLRPPKPRKNPCASAAKHQKYRAENPLFHRKTGKTHGILHTQSRNKSQPEVMRTTSIFRKKKTLPLNSFQESNTGII